MYMHDSIHLSANYMHKSNKSDCLFVYNVSMCGSQVILYTNNIQISKNTVVTVEIIT